MFYVAVLLGWPAVIASVACTSLAFRLRRPVLMIVAAVLAIPFTLYIAAVLGVPIAGPISAGLYLVGAYALMLNRPRIALLGLVPFLALVGWLATLVVGQSFHVAAVMARGGAAR